MAEAAKTELENVEWEWHQAELVSAQGNTTDNMGRFYKAMAWGTGRWLNKEWFARKHRALDEYGAYVLTDDSLVVHLTAEEIQWNKEMRRALAIASVTTDEEDNAGTGASSSAMGAIPKS